MTDTEEKWQVFDDGLDAADAKRVMEWRERYYTTTHTFRAVRSEFHGDGYFQIEGKAREGK